MPAPHDPVDEGWFRRLWKLPRRVWSACERGVRAFQDELPRSQLQAAKPTREELLAVLRQPSTLMGGVFPLALVFLTSAIIESPASPDFSRRTLYAPAAIVLLLWLQSKSCRIERKLAAVGELLLAERSSSPGEKENQKSASP